ncbi:hypothetical protein CC86DRAFT_362635 [Ophiobolus disseminans]|uniref:Zn(2)-C6 fungal-type domain-containing protein n=1 Tax=Ophiobolus disseminans TaxID=1469910 RepID=A0A6A6ZH67_9PLEO|nr:hypothetical protein CC86DRAFT_362635 [Ophiobolus disseminans]
MLFRCQRCEKMGLHCFVDTESGRCAGCIAVGAKCSLLLRTEVRTYRLFG